MQMLMVCWEMHGDNWLSSSNMGKIFLQLVLQHNLLNCELKHIVVCIAMFVTSLSRSGR